MKDKFSVDFDQLTQTMPSKKAYRLSDVAHRIEKVAYDVVRFRDNDDTEQLWKIHETPDGPMIVALYNDSGGLVAESDMDNKKEWEAIPDKTAMHIFYKGEHLTSLGSDQLGVPVTEFNTLRRWLPEKLASDQEIQKELFGKIKYSSRQLIANRFPELTKVAQVVTTDLDDEVLGDTDLGPNVDKETFVNWNSTNEEENFEDETDFEDEFDVETDEYEGDVGIVDEEPKIDLHRKTPSRTMLQQDNDEDFDPSAENLKKVRFIKQILEGPRNPGSKTKKDYTQFKPWQRAAELTLSEIKKVAKKI